MYSIIDSRYLTNTANGKYRSTISASMMIISDIVGKIWLVDNAITR